MIAALYVHPRGPYQALGLDCSGPRGPTLPSATKLARTLTPLSFARYLIDLATAAQRE